MLKIAVKRRPVVGQGSRGAGPQELKPGADALRRIVSTVSVEGLHGPDPRWIPLIHFNRMVVGGLGGMMLLARSTSKGFSLV
jgi:hypothetical protein